jgi:hypothetical protein
MTAEKSIGGVIAIVLSGAFFAACKWSYDREVEDYRKQKSSDSQRAINCGRAKLISVTAEHSGSKDYTHDAYFYTCEDGHSEKFLAPIESFGGRAVR